MDEDRLKHSIAVARKMVEIGRGYNLNDDELKDLFVLGFNHDIGYEYGDNSNHAHIGGEILKRNSYEYWKEIYYHGDINTEYTSLFLEILNKADMQIDKFGNDVGYEKRLEDIKNRYGENSKTYNDAKVLIGSLRGENMNFNINRVRIIVTVPKENTEEVRNAICNKGAGVIGNYSYCSMSTKCIGTFKPNDDANPYIGEIGKLEFVEEDKLEVVCPIEKVKSVVLKLREVHPYEEPAIDIIPLLDENDFQ